MKTLTLSLPTAARLPALYGAIDAVTPATVTLDMGGPDALSLSFMLADGRTARVPLCVAPFLAAAKSVATEREKLLKRAKTGRDAK